MRTNRITRAIGATALGLSLAFAATACGGDTSDAGSSASRPSATEHNDADVSFATDMLEHHAQALAMVDMTTGRTLDPEVQALADEIRAAQTPEIEFFTNWLTKWGEPVPATVTNDVSGADGDTPAADSTGGMDGADMSMPGMMSADAMTALENASDADFQTKWLEMMVEHHTGAVEMARTETDDGQYKPAIDLANSIAASQTTEIETMKNLLGA